MSHSLNKLWVHVVWCTKFRKPFIQPSIEKQVYQFMVQQCQAQGCVVRIVNGMPDHIHFLLLLNPKKSIAEVVKQIKGSTSHFINANQLTKEKFSWSTGYAAFGVNEKGVNIVHQYIANQKEHHKKGSIDRSQEFEIEE